MAKNKKILIIGSSIIGGSATVAAAVIAAVEINKNNKKNDVYNAKELFAKNADEIQSIVDGSSKSTIELSSLKKSLRMSLGLYRGGWFDTSDVNILGFSASNPKQTSYLEMLNFIDNASVDEVVSLNANFTKIKFIKKFATSFSESFEIKKRFEDESTKAEWFQKTKETILNWGIDAIRGLSLRHYSRGSLNDFDFFSWNDKEENQFKDFVSQEDWEKYFRYQKNDGNLITFDEVRAMINNANDLQELKNIINTTLDKPVVCFNLSDKFLLKFEKVVAHISHFSNATSTESNNVNVKLKSEWDPIFGTKNSWYQYNAFKSNYFAKNAISPMFLMERQGTSVRNSDEESYINDNEIDALSINYSMPKTYEDILDYKSSENRFNNGLIKLNENRYFENKLHQQQTPKHGYVPMSDVDMYNETMTGNWYPHIRQEYATMWQYVSKYIQWGWKTTWPTPIQVDTAHKNGVEIYGTWFNDSPSSMILRLLSDTEQNRFIWADNLIQMLKDTGVDGMLWNAEVSGWSTSGISEVTWRGWNRLLTYLNTELEKAGKKLLIHPLSGSEVPRTNADMISFLQDGDTESDYRELLSWRQSLTPANGQYDMYHYDDDYSLLDKPLGYAHRNGSHDIWLGFVDKMPSGIEQNEEIEKYGALAQARQRAEFAKNNPEYNLITLGSNALGDSMSWEGSIGDFINQEMKFLKENNIADQYYGDYSDFANGAGVADPREKFEWEMSQYISRTNTQIATGTIYDNPGNGYTSQNDTKFRQPNGWYGKGDWEQLSQDPRSESGAYSNYFQERSTIDDRNFYTSFNVGYGHKYTLNGQNVYDDWQNIGFQDFYPTYRYLIDVYDKSGQLIDDSLNNYTKRKINAFIDEVDDAYQGNDALHYKGVLEKNESFVNKLYVSNITKNKEFSIFVKNDDGLQTSLEVWRNKDKDADEIAPTKIEDFNGYKKLTFNVTATDIDKITSFGLKVRNASSDNRDINLENYRIGAISFEDTSSTLQSHSNSMSNFYAETNNISDVGINVKFDDQYFDENTRYAIYDDKNTVVAISSRPEFHIEHGGKYTIKVFNPIGQSMGSHTVNINEIKFAK